MKRLSLGDFIKLRRLVFRGARPLEYALWKCAFEGGAPGEVLEVLASYQNEDGGFGHALEANCWNPNSTPYVTAMAVATYLHPLPEGAVGRGHPIVQGILRYLGSGEYATQTGWLGLNGVPSNNAYAHAPWFHHDPSAQPEALDSAQVAEFILRYGEKGSALYQKAQKIRGALPKERPLPDFSGYDPTQFQCWLPLPTDFVGAPDAPIEPRLRALVDAELDGIVDRLAAVRELPVPGVDVKADWLDNPQIISCYASTCGFFILQLELLRKFGRLAFALPFQPLSARS